MARKKTPTPVDGQEVTEAKTTRESLKLFNLPAYGVTVRARNAQEAVAIAKQKTKEK